MLIPWYAHGHLSFEMLTVLLQESSLTLEMLIANVQLKGKPICRAGLAEHGIGLAGKAFGDHEASEGSPYSLVPHREST